MKKRPYIWKMKSVAVSNEKGFTLIEVMFSLVILSIIVFYMTPLFQLILDNKENQSILQAMEWEVFCSQIKKEIRWSTKAEVVSNRLILTKDGETIYYEIYGNNLRRRVNSTGHEIILQNVSWHSFALVNNAVKVTVKDLKGIEYSVTAYSLIDWNKST
ncbi:competence type IV pilus minor pilin ComGF [Neobacillus sp. 114]|uniref:competence type IV pilus minor pilin ComGF n=1 Tax=Neobacillus sp. 114 TaxID=3048535 RepID=UPI0024C27FA4|nr:competence type IV pilus minor pilin ComGF [Neobacillus sp. 114]